MSKFSPGPWRMSGPWGSGEKTWDVLSADSTDVANVISGHADARLIAAAPELLQWVRAYQDRMDDSEGQLAALLARIERRLR